MVVISIFVSSNKVQFYIYNPKTLEYKFTHYSFFPSFQGNKDLEYLVLNFLNEQNLSLEETKLTLITTNYNLEIFGIKNSYLNNELKEFKDFCYIYFDNFTFFSDKNISCLSLDLSSRSDNTISNKSIFPVDNYTMDIEELVFLSKSLKEFYTFRSRKVVLGGDYFTNKDVPEEFKLNLISELISGGFYEIYIDTDNIFPNILNLYNNMNIILSHNFSFEKFVYLISTQKDLELMINHKNNYKYIEVYPQKTYFLHLGDILKLNLQYKGKEISKGEVELDTEFSGIFIDRRSFEFKKLNFGVTSFRELLLNIQEKNDYSSL